MTSARLGSPAQFMQPSPGRLIAAQAQHPLQPQSADAVLPSGHPPHGPEPSRERSVRILEDRSRRDRNLVVASGTLPQNGTQGPSLGRAWRRQIIEELKLFERAWGLACGLAEEDPAIGAKATDGLRGIRAIHRWLDLNAKKEKITLTFDLLSNQVRYGGNWCLQHLS